MKRVLVLTFFVFISILIAYGIISTVIPPSISQTSYQTIQLRRDTTANWTSANPILAQGEFGYDTTLKKLKIGDGISHWLELDYITLTPTEIEDLFPTFSYSLLRTGDDVTLYGDEEYPGNSKLYGTNGSGTKGWYSKTYPTALNFQYSITQSGINVNLVNDSASPGNEKYYGTDSSGAKGYSDLPVGRWCSYDPYGPFGDGSDGDVTISTNTTLSDSTLGVKVLKYNNLTVNSGIYLESHANDKVLVLLVKGTLTLNGEIRMLARGGGGGSAPAQGYSGNPGGIGGFGGGGGGSVDSGQNGGGGGGGGQAGTAAAGGGDNHQYRYGGSSVGLGGDGHTGAGAGAAGSCYYDSILSPLPFSEARRLSGGGGGSGGHYSTGYSGAGGAGAGIIWIEANKIVWGGSGTLSAYGGNGGASSGVNAGGGGGAGGFIQVVYKEKTGNSTINVLGVDKGDGYSTYDGGAGAAGVYGEFKVQ
jgi:hypothetical protein